MLYPASPKMRAMTPCPHDTVHAGCGPSMRGEACLLYATRKECFISNQRTGLFLLASFGVAPFTGATPFPWTHLPYSPLTARLDRVVSVSAHMHVRNYVCLCVFLSELGSYYSLIPLKYFWKKNRGGEAGSVANAHAPLNLCTAHNETFIFKALTVRNGP